MIPCSSPARAPSPSPPSAACRTSVASTSSSRPTKSSTIPPTWSTSASAIQSIPKSQPTRPKSRRRSLRKAPSTPSFRCFTMSSLRWDSAPARSRWRPPPPAMLLPTGTPPVPSTSPTPSTPPSSAPAGRWDLSHRAGIVIHPPPCSSSATSFRKTISTPKPDSPTGTSRCPSSRSRTSTTASGTRLKISSSTMAPPTFRWICRSKRSTRITSRAVSASAGTSCRPSSCHPPSR
mmetsp:Transcript_28690/g.80865  ORF Transcript_28690/g.80865 Transcript_28690/m.80865 type:complete len:234 (+) Transcript_28690:749-1450(+)